MNTQNKRIRWLYLAIGTAALLFAGIIYGWSVLKAPLAAEFGWTASALSLNFTFTMCFFCVGGIVGGMLSARLGFRLTCIISAILAGSGFALSAAMCDSIIVLYISYGLMGGLGIGMAYNAVISTVSMWFPDKKGLCSGVLMMGFGASTLILGKLADSIISTPEMGWRTAFRIIGIALGIVILIAGTIIKRPEQVGASKKAAPEDDGKSYTAVKMLKSAAFRKAFILLVFLVAVGNTVISMAKDLAISVGIAATAATTLVGVLSVCNGLGRVITGAVFDKYGRRTTMLGANIVTICAACIILAAVLTDSAVLCVAGLCLAGLSYGTCPTISSAFTSEVFGPKHFAVNFSIMNCNLIFASFIATGSSLIFSATGGYGTSFILLLGLSIIALFINIGLED